jgi:hypothetical protein
MEKKDSTITGPIAKARNARKIRRSNIGLLHSADIGRWIVKLG